ncbi:MAG: hypothetical protein SVU94_05005 [Bacteroidota bacterium]|nr:hypothetical protein [Bacteroidota bacterium]
MSNHAQTNKSKWLDTPLKIDGESSDWDNRPSNFDADSKILYELKNDDNNIYVIFELTEKTSEMNFIRAGFELTMYVKSKPKIKASINFLPQQIQKQSVPDIDRVNNHNGMHEGYLLSSNYAEVSGFLKTTDIINRNINDNQDFTYNIGWNDLNNMIVEIKIPISEVFATANEEVDYTKIPIRLNCKLNALERPSGEQMHPGGGGMHGGGASGGNSGGRQGGGGRPGGQRGSADDVQIRSSVKTFKAKYYLSMEK